MKYLKPVLKSLRSVLCDELGFVERVDLSARNQSVYGIGKKHGRYCYLVIDFVESSTRCRLSVYLYSSAEDKFLSEYVPTEFPNEWRDKPITAFDIGFLAVAKGVVWSLYNDKIDKDCDGGLKGGDETIAARGRAISERIIGIVRGPLADLLG